MPRLSDTDLTIAELGLRYRLEEQARWLAELRARQENQCAVTSPTPPASA